MTYAGDLSVQQAWDLLKSDPDAVLVDVRTQAEWNYVGIPDISSLNKRTVLIEWVGFPGGDVNRGFVEQLREAGVADDTPVAFLCRSGQRSIGAAEAATADGVIRAYNVQDGFEGGLGAHAHRDVAGWKVAGLPWRQS